MGIHLYLGDDTDCKYVTNALEALAKGQTSIMSAITDWAAKEQADLTNISSTLDGVAAGVKNLDTMIQNLQSSPGTLGPGDQSALDAISAASAALATKASAISTTPPVPTS